MVARFSQHRAAPRTLFGLAMGLILGVLLLIVAIPLVLVLALVGLVGAGVLRIQRALTPAGGRREPLSGRRNVRVLRPADRQDTPN
ncbi:MAG: hypothetical protein EA378_06320 [Phycisphaerales bacterium]|nr:MAG: hypothetical protein EA378_06320 [Phycisphaerales bacterium]